MKIASTVAVFVLAITIGFFVGTERGFHREADIKAGVAEWAVNPQTGEVAFMYKTPMWRSLPKTEGKITP